MLRGTYLVAVYRLGNNQDAEDAVDLVHTASLLPMAAFAPDMDAFHRFPFLSFFFFFHFLFPAVDIFARALLHQVKATCDISA